MPQRSPSSMPTPRNQALDLGKSTKFYPDPAVSVRNPSFTENAATPMTAASDVAVPSPQIPYKITE